MEREEINIVEWKHILRIIFQFNIRQLYLYPINRRDVNTKLASAGDENTDER